VFVYGASISGSTLVLGGLAISTKKIWPRIKEVEERKVSFLRLSMGHSGARNIFLRLSMGCNGAKCECMWVTVKQSVDVCRLTMYESQICGKVLKKVPFS
jgi:hypothetical protein